MYKHMLIPTDGSPLAEAAAIAGVRLAKLLGARVTGYCAVRALRQEFYGEHLERDPLLAQLKREAMEAGERHVAVVEQAADELGVDFAPLVDAAEPVYQGILDAAHRQKCDLIFMPSHGRKGLKRLLLGSVTSQVLAHCDIALLVYR
jgi:nucleotide-binding universal stress UspA family protein